MLVPDIGAIVADVLAANQPVIARPHIHTVDQSVGSQRLIGAAGVPCCGGAGGSRRAAGRSGSCSAAARRSRRRRQRVDEADTRHVDGPTEIRRYPAAVLDLVSRVGAGDELIAEIVLAKRAGGAAERVDVAGYGAGGAEVLLKEILPVIQSLLSEHAPDLNVAPGLVAAGGRDIFRHRGYQRVEK